ncbi:MAG: dnaQ, partial [Noviherbaspirillum sp.]|nr:dnaQ [Noviherbaspirillum sp.]
MIATHRFYLALLLLFALQLAVIAAFLLLAGLGSLQAERMAMLAALACMLLLFLGIGLKALFNAYLQPLARLGEEVTLLAANPSYRVTPHGARDVRALIAKLNGFAMLHHALQEESKQTVETASRALMEERNRLAALMADLVLAVLVCNLEGRILLYNVRARQLLGSASIGLGRSVFAVIEHGLIVHALEHVQHRLGRRRRVTEGEATRFVAPLADGRILRVHLAPVLDEACALNGFVLTLEDITRNVEAAARRDSLMQTLTQDARASLENIRSAVKAMQDSADAGTTEFVTIVDDESLRLARRIESAMLQHGEDPGSRWELEEMRGKDLVALLLHRIDASRLRVVAVDGDALWLNVDSYALTRALAYLAGRLAQEREVGDLRLSLYRVGRQACIELCWDGPPLSADTLRSWENAPLQIGFAGAARTLRSVAARHGGETMYQFEPSDKSSWRLLLPAIEQAAADLPHVPQTRPEFYDFDLFNQAGQNPELDGRLLSQISYTAFDTETTGLQPSAGDEIVSIGAVRILNGRLLQQEIFDRLIRPRQMLSAESIEIHGITKAMLDDQPRIEEVLPQFQRFAADTVLVAHNAAFDMRFLQMQEARTGVAFRQPVLDTLLLSQSIHPHQPQHSLDAIAARFGVAV